MPNWRSSATAEKEYETNTGENASHHGSDGCWRRYSRNLALAANRICPPAVFDLTVAARGIVDDNYAWEVWEAAGRYPPAADTSDICRPCGSRGEEMWLDTRNIRLRRRFPAPSGGCVPSA